MTKQELAQYIDQTLLAPTATKEEVRTFIENSIPYGFKSICINQEFIPLAKEILKNSPTKICTVIDFPLGAGGIDLKISQADLAITQGADELDFVVNLSLVKAHEWKALTNELNLIIKSTGEASLFREVPGKVLTKLILETCLLTDEEIIETCKCAENAGFDFVKTSTGFASVKPNGATEHAVSLMRQTVGNSMGVKASGSIHSTGEALALIAAGASRLGASAGIAIVDGLNS